MPRGRKDSTDLLQELDDLADIGARATSESSKAAERKKKKEKIKEIEKKNRIYTTLYIISFVLFFGLGLLVIALINYFTGDGFTIF